MVKLSLQQMSCTFVLYCAVQCGPILGSLQPIRYLQSVSLGRLIVWSARKLYTQFVLGYALVSFCLFTFERYSFVRCASFSFHFHNISSRLFFQAAAKKPGHKQLLVKKVPNICQGSVATSMYLRCGLFIFSGALITNLCMHLTVKELWTCEDQSAFCRVISRSIIMATFFLPLSSGLVCWATLYVSYRRHLERRPARTTPGLHETSILKQPHAVWFSLMKTKTKI